MRGTRAKKLKKEALQFVEKNPGKGTISFHYKRLKRKWKTGE